MISDRTRDRDYLPLSSYGLIGDCRTAALVSDQGSIDWLCAPDFDSPSVFARLLDARRGGHFVIRPVRRFGARAAYLGHSAVLQTTYCTDSGAATLTDFMPLAEGDEGERLGMPRAQRRLVRLVEGLDGALELEVEFCPRPDYARRASEERIFRCSVRGGRAHRFRSRSHGA